MSISKPDSTLTCINQTLNFCLVSDPVPYLLETLNPKEKQMNVHNLKEARIMP